MLKDHTVSLYYKLWGRNQYSFQGRERAETTGVKLTLATCQLDTIVSSDYAREGSKLLYYYCCFIQRQLNGGGNLRSDVLSVLFLGTVHITRG